VITCQCPYCNGVLHIPEEYAGRIGRCALCGETFRALDPEMHAPLKAGLAAAHQRQRWMMTAALTGLLIAIGILAAGVLAFHLTGKSATRDNRDPGLKTTRNQPRDWVYFPSRERPDGPGSMLALSGEGLTAQIPADADAVLISYLADQTLGTSPAELAVSLGDTNRVLLRFDLPGSSPVEITRAVLTLDLRPSQLPPPDSFEAGVYRVTGSWDESSISWRKQPAFEPVPVATFTIEPASGTVQVEITSLVRSWYGGAPNFGLLIKVLDPLAEALPESPEIAPPVAIPQTLEPAPVYAQRVDTVWSSPPLPFPPKDRGGDLLPWPQESPGLSVSEKEKLRQDIWLINNFPLYQYGDANAYCHNGFDLVLENGMPVFAMKDGYVKSTKYSTVIIADQRGDQPSWAWSYTHLGNVRVSAGDFVKCGAPIGEIQFEGLPHLHLERIYSVAPYWGEWCYAVLPDRYFTYPDDDPPVIEAPFHFLKNMSNEAFKPDASGTITVSGDVDIVVGMREQGLYARSRENGFGDRLAVAKIQYEIRNVQSGRSEKFESFDFTRLAIKESVNDLGFNTQVTNVLYKHPRLFEPERANFDKTLAYYIITNCPSEEPPVEVTPELAPLAWQTAATDSAGKPQYPDGVYKVSVTAWDFTHHASRATTQVKIQNGR